MSDEMNDFNTQVITEFRANGGRLGGPFEGAPVVLVHHTGARSGAARVTPLMSQPDGEDVYIFASMGGAPTNPAWFHNLKANPATTIEIPAEGDSVRTVEVEAVEVTGQARDEVWDQQKQAYPQFAEYEASTSRTIPVVALRRR